LNALAGIDPNMAMGVQQGRLGMDATRHGMQMDEANLGMRQQELAITKENARMRGLEFAATMDAQSAAQTAAALERAIAMGTQAQTPEQWDAVMSQLGEDGAQYVGQFENRDMIIAGALGLSEALKMGQGPEPADEYGRYVAEETAAGRMPLSRIEFSQALKGNGVTQTITNPDGTTTTIQVGGKAGGGKPLTEGQSKDNVYATRAEGALAKLEPVADALAGRAGRIGDALSGISMGLSREVLQSDEYQVAKQAGDEYLQAILRKDTGAAITEPEQALYGVTYLPQPGDRTAVLQAKREARARALAAIQAGMSLQQLEMVTLALAAGDTATADQIINQATGGAAPAAPAAPEAPAAPVGDFSTMGLAEIGQVDIGSLTLEQMDALEARMTELGL
jgi:hypothetical protein